VLQGETRPQQRPGLHPRARTSVSGLTVIARHTCKKNELSSVHTRRCERKPKVSHTDPSCRPLLEGLVLGEVLGVDLDVRGHARAQGAPLEVAHAQVLHGEHIAHLVVRAVGLVAPERDLNLFTHTRGEEAVYEPTHRNSGACTAVALEH